MKKSQFSRAHVGPSLQATVKEAKQGQEATAKAISVLKDRGSAGGVL